MQVVHWRVAGRVQGVGFRWFVREAARRLDLAGWVSNRPDGTVELAAGGRADRLDALQAEVRRGPPGAEVTDLITLAEPDAADLPKPFTIFR